MRIDDVRNLPDGTYLMPWMGGDVQNYGDRWSYGYIVPERSLNRDPQFGELFGVWTDPDSGHTFVDLVQHVTTYETARNLADQNGEIAIYDLRERKVIYL